MNVQLPLQDEMQSAWQCLRSRLPCEHYVRITELSGMAWRSSTHSIDQLCYAGWIVVVLVDGHEQPNGCLVRQRHVEIRLQHSNLFSCILLSMHVRLHVWASYGRGCSGDTTVSCNKEVPQISRNEAQQIFFRGRLNTNQKTKSRSRKWQWWVMWNEQLFWGCSIQLNDKKREIRKHTPMYK